MRREYPARHSLETYYCVIDLLAGQQLLGDTKQGKMRDKERKIGRFLLTQRLDWLTMMMGGNFCCPKWQLISCSAILCRNPAICLDLQSSVSVSCYQAGLLCMGLVQFLCKHGSVLMMSFNNIMRIWMSKDTYILWSIEFEEWEKEKEKMKEEEDKAVTQS